MTVKLAPEEIQRSAPVLSGRMLAGPVEGGLVHHSDRTDPALAHTLAGIFQPSTVWVARLPNIFSGFRKRWRTPTSS